MLYVIPMVIVLALFFIWLGKKLKIDLPSRSGLIYVVSAILIGIFLIILIKAIFFDADTYFNTTHTEYIGTQFENINEVTSEDNLYETIIVDTKRGGQLASFYYNFDIDLNLDSYNVFINESNNEIPIIVETSRIRKSRFLEILFWPDIQPHTIYYVYLPSDGIDIHRFTPSL